MPTLMRVAHGIRDGILDDVDAKYFAYKMMTNSSTFVDKVNFALTVLPLLDLSAHIEAHCIREFASSYEYYDVEDFMDFNVVDLLERLSLTTNDHLLRRLIAQCRRRLGTAYV